MNLKYMCPKSARPLLPCNKAIMLQRASLMGVENINKVLVLLRSEVVVEQAGRAEGSWVRTVHWIANKDSGKGHAGWRNAIGLDT